MEPTADGRLAEALQPFVDRHELAGAVVLAADKDSVLSLETIGFADIAAGQPMRPDSLFWIASQTKPVTTTALMMLVDEGKVSVDEAVETYLPEFKGQWLIGEQDDNHQTLRKPRHPITVRNILSHTSGMPFMSAMEVPTLDLLKLHDAVRSYAITPLQFEPDTQYQYSNAGINTAGRIIEVVSGLSYEEFLDRRIFGPLRMDDTTFWPNPEQIGRLAKSYRPGPGGIGLEEIAIGQLKYPLNDRIRQPMPAGGLFSTAADMARFCQMVLNGGVYAGLRYLSEAAVQQMTSKQTGSLQDEYGFGWGTGDKTFGHGGAHATHMNVDTGRGLVMVFLVQSAGFPGNGGEAPAAFNRAAQALYDTGQRA